MSGKDKAYVQTRDGAVVEVKPSEVKAKLESGDYLPATASDKADADKRAANSTLGAKAKTFAESAGAAAIDTIEAPIALPLRANAALWGDEDPLKDLHGRQTIENAATIFGEAKNRLTGKNETGESYGRQYGENARARAEANPGTTTAGNLAGSLAAGGALSGGAGALGASAAKALGGGALARAAGTLATGALEGSAYGQAQAGEEAYLHNIPLSGEKLIAAMGWGAVLGGGVSLAAHGAGALLRRGSRGATPLDSPKLGEGADLGSPDVERTAPIDVNVGAFDQGSMRGPSFDYLRTASPADADRLGKPRIEIYPDGRSVADGRHRMTLAAERGDKSIAADVIHYDEEGNVVSRSTQDVSLSNTPNGGKWREAVTMGEPEAAPLDSGASLDASGLPATPAAPGRMSSALREFADERTAKALGARGSSLKKLGRTAEQAETTMHDMAQTVRGVALDDGTPVFRALDSQSELASRVAQAKEETGVKLGDFRKQADEVFQAHPEIAPQADAIADRIEREIAAPLEDHPLSATRAQAAPIRQVVNDIRELAAPRFEAVSQGARSAGDEPFVQFAHEGRGPAADLAPTVPVRKIVQPKPGKTPVSVSDLTKLRQGLDDQIYQAKRGVNLTQQGAPPNLKDLERARGILEESIEAASDKAATFFDKPAAQSYKQIKTQWRHLNLASDIAGAAELQDLGNRVVSPSDYGAGAIGGILGGGPIGAVASAIAHKTIREHSSAVLAVLADKLANNLDGKIESGLGAFFRESTARAVSPVAGAVSAVPIRRIATPAAVDAFMGRSKDLATAYDKRVRELVDANRDMGGGVRGAMQTAMGGGYEAMPRLTQAATVTATRGAQYLQSQLPGGTAAPTVFQPSRKSSPSDLQIREFAQKWAAVANPLSVIDDLRRGTVTHAQIDALKAVYPQMYAEVQQKALTKIRDLDAQGKRMPFNDRLSLDLFLDLDGAGEPTLAGKFIDRVAGAQAAKAHQDAQQKPHGSSGALAKIGATRQSGAQAALGG